MEEGIQKNKIRLLRIIPALLSLLIGFIVLGVLLGVFRLNSSALPSGNMTGYLLWSSRALILAGGGLLLSYLLYPLFVKRYFAGMVMLLLIILGALEAYTGILQVYGFRGSGHHLFTVTGSFFNPGPYSGYLAMVFPIGFYQWLIYDGKKDKAWWQRVIFYLLSGVLLLLLSVLPATMSRSAWIATAVGTLWVLIWFYPVKEYFNQFRTKWGKKKAGLFFTALLLFLVVLFVAGFHLKKDSANGRVFMWKITAQAIPERPFGSGHGTFATIYGDTQEQYFAVGNYAPWEEHVAGSPEYAFNEYLQIALEWGVPVLLLLLIIVAYALYLGVKNKLYGITGAIIALGVFAFSSYPFRLPVFVVTLAVLVFVCITVAYRWMFPVLSVVMVMIGIGFSSPDFYNATLRWQKVRHLYTIGAYNKASQEYEGLYPDMKKSPVFLFEYGHALHKSRQYDHSNAILEEALRKSNDPMILNIIGKNYHEKGEYEKAEQWLTRSIHRLPGRIYPYYLLTQLYNDSLFYNEKKFRDHAEVVLNKEPKVMSTAIKQMRGEVKQMVDKRDSEME